MRLLLRSLVPIRVMTAASDPLVGVQPSIVLLKHYSTQKADQYVPSKLFITVLVA